MRDFTKEEMEILGQYEQHLTTAKCCDYVRGLSIKMTNELDAIYYDLYSDHKIKTGCGRCIVQCIKQLAVKYFEQKEKEKEKETEPVVNEENKPKKTKKNVKKEKKD